MTSLVYFRTNTLFGQQPRARFRYGRTKAQHHGPGPTMKPSEKADDRFPGNRHRPEKPRTPVLGNCGTPAAPGAFPAHWNESAFQHCGGSMSNPPSTAKIAGHPLHPMLVPFPIAGFVGALVCNLVGTTDPFWFRATEYLLAAGALCAVGVRQLPPHGLQLRFVLKDNFRFG